MNETPDNKSRKTIWQDTTNCWQRLPNKAFFFVLLAAWLALFQFSRQRHPRLRPHAIAVFVDGWAV